MHINLNTLTQQITGLPFPRDYRLLGLEPVSAQPYTFATVLSDGRVTRTATLETRIEGGIPKFYVTHINKKAVAEPYELMFNFSKPFEVDHRKVTPPPTEQPQQVHLFHTMKNQKEILHNRLVTMLTSLYEATDIKITHNDGISIDGYFTYFNAQRYLVRGFKLNLQGHLDVVDFNTRETIETHEAVALQAGYTPEVAAAVVAHKEEVARRIKAESRAQMSPEERRRQYSRDYYERSKEKRKD